MTSSTLRNYEKSSRIIPEEVNILFLSLRGATVFIIPVTFLESIWRVTSYRSEGVNYEDLFSGACCETVDSKLEGVLLNCAGVDIGRLNKSL